MTNNELDKKIKVAEECIKKFFKLNNGNIAVSFSGGKDSTVLLHLVRNIFPNVKGVFFNTTNEFGDVIKFVRKTPNIEFIEPTKPFKWTLQYEGYPLVSKKFALGFERLFLSAHQRETPLKTGVRTFIWDTENGNVLDRLPYKWLFLFDEKMIVTLKKAGEIYVNKKADELIRKKIDYWYSISRQQRKGVGISNNTKIKLTQMCCHYLKKEPAKKYQKKHNVGFLIGTKITDSQLRKIAFNKINMIDEKNNKGYPLQHFTDKDIDEYITRYGLEIPEIYHKFNLTSTGCVMCGFGISFHPDRFRQLQTFLPKRWEQYKDIKNKDSDLTFGEVINIIERIISPQNNLFMEGIK